MVSVNWVFAATFYFMFDVAYFIRTLLMAIYGISMHKLGFKRDILEEGTVYGESILQNLHPTFSFMMFELNSSPRVACFQA